MNKLLFDTVPGAANEDAIFSVEQKDNNLTVHIGGKRETLLWILMYAFLHKRFRSWMVGLMCEVAVKMHKIPLYRLELWLEESKKR